MAYGWKSGVFWVAVVAVVWLLAGCTVAAASPQTVQLPTTTPGAATAVAQPWIDDDPPVFIPETATPVIALLPDDPLATPQRGGSLMAGSAPSPSPTFAVYGITHTIGFSAQQRPIVSYRFGYGTDVVVLVGGIHGGYEWNTILLAYEMIDYFLENPQQVPTNVTLYIIPSANPDGQFLVTGQEGRFTAVDSATEVEDGRFNASGVDLNRNWACDWRPTGLWGSREVSGGDRPFSEPETQALRRFFVVQQAKAVLFWHSKANGIYPGSCGAIDEKTTQLSTLYAEAAGYPLYEEFSAYTVTGDASDWLVSQDIPSFTVELRTRRELDWSRNLAGVLALLEHFSR